MTKTQQAALLTAVFAAGAGARSIATAIGGDGTTYAVHSVQAVNEALSDGGTLVMVETCGFASTPGQRDTRWCDRRVDGRMSGLVVDAPARLAEAAIAGQQHLADTHALLVARRDAGQ